MLRAKALVQARPWRPQKRVYAAKRKTGSRAHVSPRGLPPAELAWSGRDYFGCRHKQLELSSAVQLRLCPWSINPLTGVGACEQAVSQTRCGNQGAGSMESWAHWHWEVACLEHPFCTELITCAKQMTDRFLRGELSLGLPYRWLLCLGFHVPKVAFMFRWLGLISRKTHKIGQQNAFQKRICKNHTFVIIACEVWKP